MIWSSGTWHVKPGHEDEFVEAWHEFASWSAARAADAHAWLLRDRERPTTFVSIGPWPSDEAMASWRSSPGFGERIARIRGLVDAFEPRTLDEILHVAPHPARNATE